MSFNQYRTHYLKKLNWTLSSIRIGKIYTCFNLVDNRIIHIKIDDCDWKELSSKLAVVINNHFNTLISTLAETTKRMESQRKGIHHTLAIATYFNIWILFIFIVPGFNFFTFFLAKYQYIEVPK